jgi:hypothetical protein
MKPLRLLAVFLVANLFALAAFAADPTGTWHWTTHSPNGDIDTTLKLESKAGQLTGAYSNQFGEASISKASLKDDTVAFEVVRDFGGTSYTVKYNGKLEGDAINGTIEAPRPDGGDLMKLEWHAKRDAKETPAPAKPKA